MTKPYAALYAFIGIRHFKSLFAAISSTTATPPSPIAGHFACFGIILITCTPILLNSITIESAVSSSLPTVAIGVCALLTLLLRRKLSLFEKPVERWRDAFRHTHTAFALGCIPVVAVLAAWPTLLADRHDLMQQVNAGASGEQSISLAGLLVFVLAMAAWIATTEEIIFRGGLLSVLRRWKPLHTSRYREHVAVLCSSLLFGVAHYSLWGWAGAIAMTGLGFGLALGYLANGERLLPVILYHFAFDTLSISASLFL